MKKLLLLLAVMLLGACCDNSKNDVVEEPPQKILADYQGVWKGVDNDTSFISISHSGIVSYYYKKGAMGKGVGTLKNNTITIQNEYTGKMDVLEIKQVGKILNITGKISSRTYQYGSYPISWKVERDCDSYASFSGDIWTQSLWFGSTAWYTWEQWRINILGENSAIYYKYHKTNGISKEHGMYCLQRRFNGLKFLYCHFTEDDNDDTTVFWYDGKVIYNNNRIGYRF